MESDVFVELSYLDTKESSYYEMVDILDIFEIIDFVKNKSNLSYATKEIIEGHPLHPIHYYVGSLENIKISLTNSNDMDIKIRSLLKYAKLIV